MSVVVPRVREPGTSARRRVQLQRVLEVVARRPPSETSSQRGSPVHATPTRGRAQAAAPHCVASTGAGARRPSPPPPRRRGSGRPREAGSRRTATASRGTSESRSRRKRRAPHARRPSARAPTKTSSDDVSPDRDRRAMCRPLAGRCRPAPPADPARDGAHTSGDRRRAAHSRSAPEGPARAPRESLTFRFPEPAFEERKLGPTDCRVPDLRRLAEPVRQSSPGLVIAIGGREVTQLEQRDEATVVPGIRALLRRPWLSATWISSFAIASLPSRTSGPQFASYLPSSAYASVAGLPRRRAMSTASWLIRSRGSGGSVSRRGPAASRARSRTRSSPSSSGRAASASSSNGTSSVSSKARHQTNRPP